MAKLPSEYLRARAQDIPALPATLTALDKVLAIVDAEGQHHPFIDAKDMKEWERSIRRDRRDLDKLTPIKRGERLGDLCRRDPRLLGTGLVRSELMVWLLTSHDGAVRHHPIRSVEARTHSTTTKEARDALDAFVGAFLTKPRRKHISALVVRTAYKEVSAQVKAVCLKIAAIKIKAARTILITKVPLPTKDDCERILGELSLNVTDENIRHLRASHGFSEELKLKMMRNRFGLGRTKMIELIKASDAHPRRLTRHVRDP